MFKHVLSVLNPKITAGKDNSTVWVENQHCTHMGVLQPNLAALSFDQTHTDWLNFGLQPNGPAFYRNSEHQLDSF